MNVPLIQKPETNDINASLIAIRKQLQILNESVNNIENKYLLKSELNKLSADTVGGDGKYIESVSESNGIINAVEKSLGNMVPVDEVTSGNTHSVTSGAVYNAFKGMSVAECGKIGTNGFYVKYDNGYMEQVQEFTAPDMTLQQVYDGSFYTGIIRVNLAIPYKEGTTPINVTFYNPARYGATPIMFYASCNNDTDTNSSLCLQVMSFYPYNINGQKYYLRSCGWWK